ncbi:MAG: sulfatase-like hydrolase/transferase [Acidimicrobiia bacterium]|nr:sulfatase-like hydrolase/transferase [Acidimicrobiia bacterium]
MSRVILPPSTPPRFAPPSEEDDGATDEPGTLAKTGAMPLWKMAGILLGLGAVSIGQPLLDLLGQNPEFFIAHSLQSSGIVVLMIGVLLLPLLLLIPVWLARLVSPTFGGAVFLITVALLVALLAANAIGRLPLTGVWVIVLSVGVGVGVGLLFMASDTMRSVFAFLTPAPLLVAALFVWFTPTSEVLFGEISPDGIAVTGVENPVPVVLMVFDEFPVASIIDAEGNLLTETFPNLADLADDGVWYRNAVGVRQQTEEAIPTILSGIAADEGSIPVASDHPRSLFTMLSATYDVDAVETVTDLCPHDVCGGTTRSVAPIRRRWTGIGIDVGVVYAHVVTPDDLDGFLPRIDGNWGDFGAAGAPPNGVEQADGDFNIIERFLEGVEDDRRQEMPRFLDTFDQDDDARPPLRVGHFLLPHHPWSYLPDGRVHGSGGAPGADGTGWGPDEWLNEQGRQRHLLQVAYTDSVIGDAMAGLEELGIYEDALIVVVADHGITIREEIPHQRIIYPDTVGSIAAVPLFVKYPDDWEEAPEPGTIDDVRAETTDIVPTIAGVLGVDVPWETDGLSLLDPARSERTESTMVGTGGPVTFGVDGGEKLEVARGMAEWFPTGDPYELLPDRSFADLVGTTPDVAESDEVRLSLDQEETLADLDGDSEPWPSFLAGWLVVEGGVVPDDALVAILVNDRVETVTRVYRTEGDSARFQAFIDPDLLNNGANDVEAVMVGTLSEPGPPVR